MVYSDETISALVQAWDDALDYIEINGINFGMFPDGIWEINDNAILDNNSKVSFAFKPSTNWGGFAG